MGLKTTVVLCTYNGERYLNELLDSLGRQTKKIDELIISDDGSVDNTLEIISSYITRSIFKKIRMLENEKRKGASQNFVDASIIAGGDLVFFCDQDDIWEDDKVECMAKIMEDNNGINVLASNIIPLFEGKPSITTRFSIARQTNTEKLEYVKPSSSSLAIRRSGCSMCVRSSFIKRIVGKHLDTWYHDDFVWKCGVLNESCYIFNKTTVHRRIHENNASINIKRTKESRLKSIEEEILYSRLALETVLQKKEYLQKAVNSYILFQEQRYKAIQESNKTVFIVNAIRNFRAYRRFGQLVLDGYFTFFYNK